MSERLKPILGALISTLIVGYLGVTYFFAPIVAEDAPNGPMMPSWASLIVYSVIAILFYDWVNQQVRAPLKSAMIVALSQILLVDVYYVLNGMRGVVAAAASIAVLLVAWAVGGTVYGKLLGDRGGVSDAIA